jgi:hypothetical protein
MTKKISLYISPDIKKFAQEVDYILRHLEYRLGVIFERQYASSSTQAQISYGSTINGIISLPFCFDDFIILNQSKEIFYNSSTSLDCHIFKHEDYCVYGLRRSGNTYENFSIPFDLFANIFFHLTRIEELAPGELDKHGRFLLKNSLSYKFKFHQIPVVEYLVEFLRNEIRDKLNIKLSSSKEVTLLPTHDVDRLRSYHGKRTLLRETLGNILRRRNPVIKAITLLIHSLTDKEPYRSFQYLIRESEKRGLKSLFLFLCPSETSKDANYINDYPKDFDNMIALLKKHNQMIGFHPGYFSYNDAKRFKQQKTFLEDKAQVNIAYVRQHVLRWNPNTPQVQAQNGVSYDLTLAFTEGVSFRSGTTFPYKAYDLSKRKALKLKLINTPIMEFALFMDKYISLSHREALQEVRDCAKHYRRLGGVLPILFHTVTVMDMSKTYEETLDIIISELNKPQEGSI